MVGPSIVRQVQPDASVSGAAHRSTGNRRSRPAAIGDHVLRRWRWALLDRAVTAELAKNGMPSVVGIRSAILETAPPGPGGAGSGTGVAQVHGLEKERIVLIGYSFGADVLPATLARLPQDLRDRVDL